MSDAAAVPFSFPLLPFIAIVATPLGCDSGHVHRYLRATLRGRDQSEFEVAFLDLVGSSPDRGFAL
jgi:hypothetical protein